MLEDEDDVDVNEGGSSCDGEDLGVGEFGRRTGIIPLGGIEEKTIRYMGQVAASVLGQASSYLLSHYSPENQQAHGWKPLTTLDIDSFVHELVTEEHDVYPSPLGYEGFPYSLTTSINNVLCHGVPSDGPTGLIRPNDIINLDVTLYGVHPTTSLIGKTRAEKARLAAHGDTSRMVVLPQVDEAGRHLVDVTREALRKGIEVCGPGVPFKEIGRVIE